MNKNLNEFGIEWILAYHEQEFEWIWELNEFSLHEQELEWIWELNEF